MYSIILFGVDTDLRDGNSSCEKGVVCKEDIIKIDFACLFIADKIPVGVIDTVEQEACEIHGHEIEVHALDTKDKLLVTSLLCSLCKSVRRKKLTTRKSKSSPQCRSLFAVFSLPTPTLLNDRIIINLFI